MGDIEKSKNKLNSVILSEQDLELLNGLEAYSKTIKQHCSKLLKETKAECKSLLKHTKKECEELKQSTIVEMNNKLTES